MNITFRVGVLVGLFVGLEVTGDFDGALVVGYGVRLARIWNKIRVVNVVLCDNINH